jgi:hypothetical protein
VRGVAWVCWGASRGVRCRVSLRGPPGRAAFHSDSPARPPHLIISPDLAFHIANPPDLIRWCLFAMALYSQAASARTCGDGEPAPKESGRRRSTLPSKLGKRECKFVGQIAVNAPFFQPIQPNFLVLSPPRIPLVLGFFRQLHVGLIPRHCCARAAVLDRR